MSENNEKKVHGIVAEYTSVDSLLVACRRVRDAGYTKIDAFTPFAVHGIDEALGIKQTILPWIVLACGLTGLATGLAMQIWMNAINYPYIISGKPFVLSLPAFMPVVFELTVLLSCFGAFFGMWALNGLPKFSNPMFTDPRFDRATDDRFFLFVDAKDDRFEPAGVERLLGDTGTQYIQSVVDDDSSTKIPKPFWTAWGLMVALSVVPLLLVVKMRFTTSSSPRFHVFYDMDFSPSKDAQQSSTLFADGRAMRPDVPGTVIRGEMGQDMNFLTGIDMEALASIDPPRANQLVRGYVSPQGQEQAAAAESAADQSEDPSASAQSAAAQSAAAQSAAAQSAAAQSAAAQSAAAQSAAAQSAAAQSAAAQSEAAPATPSVMDTTPWLTENPLDVTTELVERGQKYFGIYCSVCHGMNGGGNGLVARRARKIMATTWIPPSKLNLPTLYEDKYPDGKLFNTISNGIRKMPGYAGQIRAHDRWAIVAYVRALQRSQDASIELIPEDRREEILKLKAEIDKQLEEAAEAERKAEEERAKQAADSAT